MVFCIDAEIDMEAVWIEACRQENMRERQMLISAVSQAHAAGEGPAPIDERKLLEDYDSGKINIVEALWSVAPASTRPTFEAFREAYADDLIALARKMCAEL